MTFRELSMSGAWEMVPRQFDDSRGVFLEWFKDAGFRDAVGHPFDIAQANMSVSAAGVVRGIHYADVPPGQAKYVTCAAGAVLDVIVDIRVGSPTFGTWESVLLDDVARNAVYLSEGLGHAFISLADASTVTYLCSTPFNPEGEHEINPLDPAIGIAWPTQARDGSALTLQFSDKDAAAPTLAQAQRDGLLPTFAASAALLSARLHNEEESA